MAQSVEHVIGNDEVISSILISSSSPRGNSLGDFFVKKLLKNSKKTVDKSKEMWYNIKVAGNHRFLCCYGSVGRARHW